MESWASREAAFLLNNWILLFSAFFILFATMFPTSSEAFTGQRITVGPPFFNTWMVPLGLALLLLTGIGTAARVAAVERRQPGVSVRVAGWSCGGNRGRALCDWFSGVGVGPVFRALRARARNDRPGVCARRICASRGDGH